MTTAEMIAFAKLPAAEKIARQRREEIWQTPDGTWAHKHDAAGGFSFESAVADLRFAKDYYRGRA